MIKEIMNIVLGCAAAFIMINILSYVINYFPKKKLKNALDLVYQLGLNKPETVRALSDSSLEQYSRNLTKVCFGTSFYSSVVMESLALIDSEIIKRKKNIDANKTEEAKNMIDNGIKIGSSKYNPIIVTFSNGRKKLSFAAPCSETNLAIMDCLSRYVGADRIDSIGENLDVNFTVTREKTEISGHCEQFVMIINNQLLQKLLNENGMLVSQS